MAKRKTITRSTSLALIDVVKEKGELDRVSQYWNTFYCQSKMISNNNRLHTNYCKNRVCATCSAIRKADLINRYYPVLEKWEDTHFVTLTVKSCKAKNLNKWIWGMYRAFKLIHNRCKKRYQRGKGIKLIGIKSLECNFNATKGTYNPHFHIIVPSKEIADLLKKEWMIQWKSNKALYTYHKAQHIRRVKDLEGDLVEVIKYGSKIFSEPDPSKRNSRRKKNEKRELFVYAYALDNILCAMKKHRLFDRFGFNLPQQEVRPVTYMFVEEYKTWIFSSSLSDWINTITGECLTGYLMPLKLYYLLNDCINKELY